MAKEEFTLHPAVKGAREAVTKTIDIPADNAWRDKARAVIIAMMGAGESLAGLDLSGSNLSGLNLGGQDLRGCDLSGADMRGTVLTALTKADGAKMVHTNLRDARVSAVDWSKTDTEKSDIALAIDAADIVPSSKEVKP